MVANLIIAMKKDCLAALIAQLSKDPDLNEANMVFCSSSSWTQSCIYVSSPSDPWVLHSEDRPIPAVLPNPFTTQLDTLKL